MEQGVRFFHSENVEGFRAHCKSKHLMCRRMLMEAIPVDYTHFESDTYDTEMGFDRRVFGNIYDLGAIYARANLQSENPAGPYVYGPIIFVFRPDVFSVMHDIVITQGGSWGIKPKWREVSIKNEAQVEEILQPDQPKDNVADNWQYAELSCANTELPLAYLEKIIVEPLTIPLGSGRYSLQKAVSAAVMKYYGVSVVVEERDFEDRRQHFKPENREMLEKLARFCEQLPPNISQQNWRSAPPQLPSEFQSLPNKLKGLMRTWAQYFTFGTVRCRRVAPQAS